MQIPAGSTNRGVTIRIVDSGDGTPEEGVNASTPGLALWYRREGGVKTAVSVSDLSALTDAHSDGGLLHVDDGYYRLDLPDAAFAVGANHLLCGGTADGMVVIGMSVELTSGGELGAIAYTYTVDDGTDPLEGAEVWISLDVGGDNTIWYGTTNASGVALDLNGERPYLDAGTYYFWVQKTGYSFSNPDTEVVS